MGMSSANRSHCSLGLRSQHLGNARVSRVGDGVSLSRTFLTPATATQNLVLSKVCFGETPKATRETRALPRIGAPGCRAQPTVRILRMRRVRRANTRALRQRNEGSR